MGPEWRESAGTRTDFERAPRGAVASLNVHPGRGPKTMRRTLLLASSTTLTWGLAAISHTFRRAAPSPRLDRSIVAEAFSVS